MPLLTIGIPTYNRSEELDNCLSVLLPQIKPYLNAIELLVSDNASDTNYNNREVVNKYLELGYPIKFHRQTENLRMDGNFIFLMQQARGKYVWLLSDDDIVAENGFKRIFEILNKEVEIGSLYLTNLWFSSSIDYSLFKTDEATLYKVYSEPLSYFKELNYWVTFLSANIVNKSAFEAQEKFDSYEGTFLALLKWTIPSIFKGLPNVIIETPILACSAKGQGGYKFIQVFGNNFNKILNTLIQEGYPKRLKKIVNDNLLKNYFPQFIRGRKNGSLNKSTSYESEKWLTSLFKIYYNNLKFYIFIVPAFLLSNYFYNKWWGGLRRIGIG